MLSCISVDVYADSGLDDILPSSTSVLDSTDSSSDSSIEDFFESDTLDIEQEENNVTSNIEEINEEIFEGIGNGDVEEYEADNGLSIDNWIQPLAIDMSIPSRYTGTGGFANGYFTLWQLNGGSIDPVAMNRSYNRDMSIILNQLKISFGAVATTLQRLDGAIDTRISTDSYLLGRIDENYSAISHLEAWRTTATGNISWLTTEKGKHDHRLNILEDWRTNHDSWAKGLARRITTNEGNITWLTTESGSQDHRLNVLDDWRRSHNTFSANLERDVKWTISEIGKHDNRLNLLEDWRTAHDNFSKGLTNRVTTSEGNISWLTTENGKQDHRLNVLDDWRQAHDVFSAALESNIDSFKTTQLAWNAVQLTNNVSQGNRITALENEINNFNLSDLIDLTVVVTAINSFKKAYTDSIATNGDLYNLILGAVTGQTTSLIGYFNGLFNDYFGDWENSIFWVQFGLFEKRHMAIFIDVFLEELDTILDKYWLEQLETWNITNDTLLTGNNWLEMIYNRLTESHEVLVIITNWLDEIYKKPTAPVIPPIPFDYERLETMLKKLEFGEIVNEAGTNIWDFLSDLIKEMSNNFRTAITEVGDILKEILDFLDGFLDRIMALIVPEDMDFMRDGFEQIDNEIKLKFSWFFTIGYQLSEIFQPSNKDFIPAVSFDFMGNEFKPNVEHLNMFVPQFRSIMTVFIWLYVSWFVYKRFTGTGDIINDN